MSDDFTRDKFARLRQVAMDRRLPQGRGNLALVFCDYLNRKDGVAWPSVDRLAGDAGITGRAVQTTIAAFVKYGHLKIKPGGGRKHTNRYSLVIKPHDVQNGEESFTLFGEETVKKASPFNGKRMKISARKSEDSCKKRVKDTSPEPFEYNPLNEPPAGCLLIEAKEAVPHGQWGPMLKEVGLSPTVAQRLMAIGRDERIKAAQMRPNGPILPAHGARSMS